jgi:hypothetical protein
VIANPRDSGLTASPQLQHTEWVEDNFVLLSKQINESGTMHYKNEKRLYKIEERVIELCNNQHQDFEEVNSKMDNLLRPTASPPRKQQPSKLLLLPSRNSSTNTSFFRPSLSRTRRPPPQLWRR